MKVLFVNNSLRGLAYFRLDVMRHLQAQGHKVVAVVPKSEEGEVDIEDIRKIFVPLRRTSVNPLHDIVFLFSLLRVFKRERPDYVFLFTIKPNVYGTLAGKLYGIHSTVMMAGLGRTFSNNLLSSRIARLLYRQVLTFSDHLLLLNEQDLENVKRFRICKLSKIVLLKSGEGVNLQRYYFRDNRSDKVRFLFVGRLLKEKGVLDFMEAARIVRQQCTEAEFQIAGKTDAGSQDRLIIENMESKSAGVVELLGHINMVEKLKEPGLVIVLPSYYSEGLNHSLMEGCAAGKPIITTDWPGCRETVIDGRNGYLVPARCPDALAEAMLRFMKLSDDEKRTMSQESRRLAEERFDIRGVFDVYDRILDRRQ